MFHLPKLILASGSPRRAEILTNVGWEFEKHVADIDETEGEGEPAEDYVVRLAKEKALAVAAHYPNAIVLGADTTVVVDDQIIAKPKDLDHAGEMLRKLVRQMARGADGRRDRERWCTETGMQRTQVKFAEMTDEEVQFPRRAG